MSKSSTDLILPFGSNRIHTIVSDPDAQRCLSSAKTSRTRTFGFVACLDSWKKDI